MAKIKIGNAPQRYSLLLNSHENVRLSKCPKCQKFTYLRKFALFIHISGWGPTVLGKTCRYCSRCDIVMVHCKELAAELASSLSQLAPEAVGNDYWVLGTIEKKIWQQGLGSRGKPVSELLKHLADFKHHYDLEYKPGGWHPAPQKPRTI